MISLSQRLILDCSGWEEQLTFSVPGEEEPYISGGELDAKAPELFSRKRT